MHAGTHGGDFEAPTVSMLRKRVEEEGDGAREKKVARSAPRRLRVGFVCGPPPASLLYGGPARARARAARDSRRNFRGLFSKGGGANALLRFAASPGPFWPLPLLTFAASPLGKEDGDLVAAPGLPAAHRCVDADAPPSGKHRRAGASSECHSDVAIWWWVRTHYASTVECDLISAPGDVTRARLEANDVNLLLGWDAVSAHLEEFDGTARFGAGHGDAKAALLRDPECKVFPPGALQDLCNAKGARAAGPEKIGLQQLEC